MKILVACETEDYKGIGDNVLRWAAKAGYQFRLFVPFAKQKRFASAIRTVNYDYYLGLSAQDIIVPFSNPKDYAMKHGYDLLVTVPDTLKSWRKDGAFTPNELVYYIKAIGSARLAFSKDDSMKIKRWANGVTMERL